MEYGTILMFLAIALLLGGTALGVNRLLMPFRPNGIKNATYECGNEPTGDAQIRYNVRFYIFALLYVVFAVEAAFLFPWAVVFRADRRAPAPRRGDRLHRHPHSRPGLRVAEGGPPVGLMNGVDPKSLLLRMPGGQVLVSSLDRMINASRSNSLWTLTFGLACCAIEMMATGASTYDWARFGFEVPSASPRRADMMIVAGTVVRKMVPDHPHALRADAGPEVRDRHGRVRHFRRPLRVRLLHHRARGGGDRSRGRVHPRLPSAARGAAPWPDDPAGTHQGPDREDRHGGLRA